MTVTADRREEGPADADLPRPKDKRPTCISPDCELRRVAKGNLCEEHMRQAKAWLAEQNRLAGPTASKRAEQRSDRWADSRWNAPRRGGHRPKSDGHAE